MAKAKERIYPHVVVRHPSPNVSSRGGASITLGVLHATAGHNRKGISDLTGLGDWFGQQASQVSSHTADDNEGQSARFVDDSLKAWHCCNWNRMGLGHEQVAPGDGTEWTTAQYKETARWMAYWNLKHALPIRWAKLDFASLTVIKPGWRSHKSLGVSGGGHGDPGPKYRWRFTFLRGKWYRHRMRHGH